MFGIGPAEIVMVLALAGGGLGVPLSVPPLPPDPALRGAAPETCLLYLRTAGLAQPSSKSGNHTEQLLAEPEVAQFVADVGQQIDSVLKQIAEKDPKAGQVRDLALPIAKTVATRPLQMFVEKFVPPSKNGPPDIKAALVVNVGPQKAAIEAIVKQIEQMAAASGDPQPTDVTIEKASLRQVKPPQGPTITWGFQGDYFLVTFGDTTAAEVLRRMAKPAATPQWLSAAEGLAGKSRVSTVGYFNVAAVLDLVRSQAGDPKAAAIIDTLGLANVKSISSVAGLDDQGMINRTHVLLDGAPQGLLELVAEKPLAAADLKPIASDATYALAARLDLAAVYKKASQRIAQIEPGAPAQVSARLDALEKPLGFHVERDLLPALGDVWTVHTAGAAGAGGWTSLVITVTARDPKKLIEIQDKLQSFAQQAAGPQAPFTIRDTTIGTIKARQLVFKGPVPVSPAWCIADNQLIVAASAQTLKVQLSRTTKTKSLADVPAVASRIKAGVSVLTYEDSKSTLRTLYGAVQAYGPIVTGMAAQQGIEFTLPTLPALDAVEPHVLPAISTLRRTKTGIGHENQQSLPLGGGSQLVTSPVLVALLLPAVQSAREAARRSASSNNLKQLALAMHNHYADKKTLPPPAIVDKAGKPLLSWRVAVLPYVDEKSLYDQFHLDEPWDSQHNKALLEKMPGVFANPSSSAGPGKTVYLLPTGPGTMFADNKPVTFPKIIDGTSNTIMIVEASDAAAVDWTKPDDLKLNPDKPKAGLEGARSGGFQVSLADGSVRMLSDSIDLDTLKALFTPDGREPVNP
jgi:hypothetical protein